MGFGESCDYKHFFLRDFLPKIVQELITLRFIDFSKDILSSCEHNRSNLSFVASAEMPGEAVKGF